MKFYVTVLYLDIHTKSTKLLNKNVLDQKSFTLFEDGDNIKQAWHLFSSSSFQTVKEIIFQYREITFHARVDGLDVNTTTGKVLGKTLLDLSCWTLFQYGGRIRRTLPMFDFILSFTR